MNRANILHASLNFLADRFDGGVAVFVELVLSQRSRADEKLSAGWSWTHKPNFLLVQSCLYLAFKGAFREVDTNRKPKLIAFTQYIYLKQFMTKGVLKYCFLLWAFNKTFSKKLGKAKKNFLVRKKDVKTSAKLFLGLKISVFQFKTLQRHYLKRTNKLIHC